MRDQETVEELLRIDLGHNRLDRRIQQVMDNENCQSTGQRRRGLRALERHKDRCGRRVSDHAGDETFQPLFTPIGAEPMRWLRNGPQKQF